MDAVKPLVDKGFKGLFESCSSKSSASAVDWLGSYKHSKMFESTTIMGDLRA